MKRFFRELGLLVLTGAIAFVLVGQQAQYGLKGTFHWTTGNTAADTAAIGASRLAGVLTGTPTAAATYTTDTAVNWCKVFPFVGNANGVYDYDFYVKNTSAGAFAITLAGGTGVTVSGTATAAQNAVRHFHVSLNSCVSGSEAVRVWSLETTAF